MEWVWRRVGHVELALADDVRAQQRVPLERARERLLRGRRNRARKVSEEWFTRSPGEAQLTTKEQFS